MAHSHQAQILIVNHGADVALLLKLAVQDAFPTAVVQTTTDEARAEQRLFESPPDVVIVAVEDSPAQAWELAQILRAAGIPPNRLILTGNRPDMPRLVRELGASTWLRRPARRVELESAVRRALQAPGLPAHREDAAPPGGAERHIGAERPER